MRSLIDYHSKKLHERSVLARPVQSFDMAVDLCLDLRQYRIELWGGIMNAKTSQPVVCERARVMRFLFIDLWALVVATVSEEMSGANVNHRSCVKCLFIRS